MSFTIDLVPQVQKSVRRLSGIITDYGLQGYDPYDALNSPLLHALSRRSRVMRIGFIQVIRRLPINIRSLLGVKRDTHSKTVSLLGRAYLKLAANENLDKTGEFRKLASHYLDYLVQHPAPGFEAAWGYNVPWQSSRLYLDKGAPSVVCTAEAGLTLLAGFDLFGKSIYLEKSIAACDFLLNSIPRYEDERGICFSYIPQSGVWVHNANLLAAALLAKVYHQTGDPRFADFALRATKYSLEFQNSDGSWFYDSPPGHVKPFIDGFHSGFMLECIRLIQEGLGNDIGRAEFEKGLEFYRLNLFEPDGRPRRSIGNNHVVDIRDCAEAIIFFTHKGHSLKENELSERVLLWTLEHMRTQQGYFCYEWDQLLGRNPIYYPRWQSWMMLALAGYLNNKN